jgi:hypothetical protein
MPKQPQTDRLRDYLGVKTLITGDVNSGKTRLTEELLRALCRYGAAGRTALLDLAPERLKQAGGKIQLAKPPPTLLYLTCHIVAPRLTGQNATQVQHLAETNARAIEPLIDQVLAARRTILVVNDASIYLQAGRMQRFLDLLAGHETVIVNAYKGHSFAPAPFTQLERKRVDALADCCEKVIRL